MKKSIPIIIVLLIAATTRIFVYLVLPDVKESISPLSLLYYDALKNHLADYIYFQSGKPPLFFIIQSILFSIFSPERIIHYHLHFLLVFVLDLGAMWLLYLTLMHLRINAIVSAVILLIFSIAYIPFELWKLDWGHYDHYYLFFTSFFIYGLIRYLEKQNGVSTALLAIASTLIIALATVYALIVFIIVPIATGLVSLCIKENWRTFLKKLSIVLICPLVLLIGLCLKTFHVSGVFATSNEAGAAIMLSLWRVCDQDINKVREAVIDSGAPDWYVWCFDNAVPYYDETGKPDDNWLRIGIAKLFGICYPWGKFGSEYWPYDFRPLRDKLRELDQEKLAAIIDRDIWDSQNRPHRFVCLTELCGRWSGYYGNISVRVFFKTIMQHPYAFLRTVKNLHYTFSRMGSRWPQLLLKLNPAKIDANSVKWVLHYITMIYGRIIYIAYILIYFVWMLLVILAISRWLTGDHRKLSNMVMTMLTTFFRQFIVISITVLLMTCLFSTIVGSENERFFMYISTYLILVFITSLNTFWRWAMERMKIGIPGQGD